MVILINFWAKMTILLGEDKVTVFGPKLPFLKGQSSRLLWVMKTVFGRMLPLFRYKVTGFERKNVVFGRKLPFIPKHKVTVLDQKVTV